MDLGETAVTRRKLIKRAGIGAAAVMASPVIASSAQAESARKQVCGKGCPCAGDCCFNQTPCKPASSACTCIQRLAGPTGPCPGTPNDPRARRCFCHQGSFCRDLSPCTRGADCPPGWACACSCCSYTPDDLFCHPPCGTQAGVAGARHGRMSNGAVR